MDQKFRGIHLDLMNDKRVRHHHDMSLYQGHQAMANINKTGRTTSLFMVCENGQHG
ncbi:MAG: hypothetical protein HQM11_06610 [SAR324 cluster bacterium]|nr:hypothetical protein [SAR324 cluster bacterium]